jgi:hypothetical protein
MPQDEEIKIPTQPGAPTSEHGQIMFAMGKMFGRLDAIDAKQAYANGRTGKLEARMDEVEKWQNTSNGASLTWGKIAAFFGAFLVILISAITLIVKLIK